jgi:hypothetical protein
MHKLALLLCLIALAPMWPAARVSAAQPPATNFDVTLQVSGSDVNLSAEITGVANQSGDMQVSVATSDPEVPSIDVIVASGVPYISIAGGPYQALTDDTGLPFAGFGRGRGGKLPPMELPAGCEATAMQLQSLVESQSGPQILKSLAGIQDLGPVSIDGATAEHFSGSVSFDTLLANPFVSAAVDQAIASCSGPTVAISRSDIQSFLAGATATFDASLDANNVPRQFSLTLNVPSLPLQFSASGTVTPLAAPAAISAPS